jgi:hypothetical protein
MNLAGIAMSAVRQVISRLAADRPHTIGELEELFSITRSTGYRTIARDRVRMAPLTLGAAMSAPAERAEQDAR